jgi:hypothetical protein
MKFEPKTDKQIAEMNLLPEGEYPFQISAAIDEVSKSSGLDMITLTVRVFKPDGNFNLVTDYLSSSPKAAFKLNNICKALGLKAEYDSGTLKSDDFLGKEGMLVLGIKSSPGYNDQNTVKSYIVKEGNEPNKPLPKKDVRGTVAEDMDDDIPF